MKYLMCQEGTWLGGWTYDFWTADSYIDNAIRMSIDEMLLFVDIVARQSKADVTFSTDNKMYTWINGSQVS